MLSKLPICRNEIRRKVGCFQASSAQIPSSEITSSPTVVADHAGRAFRGLRRPQVGLSDSETGPAVFAANLTRVQTAL